MLLRDKNFVKALILFCLLFIIIPFLFQFPVKEKQDQKLLKEKDKSITTHLVEKNSLDNNINIMLAPHSYYGYSSILADHSKYFLDDIISLGDILNNIKIDLKLKIDFNTIRFFNPKFRLLFFGQKELLNDLSNGKQSIIKKKQYTNIDDKFFLSNIIELARLKIDKDRIVSNTKIEIIYLDQKAFFLSLTRSCGIKFLDDLFMKKLYQLLLRKLPNITEVEYYSYFIDWMGLSLVSSQIKKKKNLLSVRNLYKYY